MCAKRWHACRLAMLLRPPGGVAGGVRRQSRALSPSPASQHGRVQHWLADVAVSEQRVIPLPVENHVHQMVQLTRSQGKGK